MSVIPSTPLLSYDVGVLKSNINFFKKAFPQNCAIRFASMANSRTEVLKEVYEFGLCFFVNSIAHLQLLENLSLVSHGVVFAASGNSEAEMKYINGTNALFLR